MPEIKDIRLTTQPTAWPVPNRPAPPVPTASKPAPQAGGIVLKAESQNLLEWQRPAPISTGRTLMAEPADTEVWSTPPQSPSALSSPSSLPSPSWPSSPEAHKPVRPPLDTKGKGKATVSPPSAQARTSAGPPVNTGSASPTEASRHPADVAEAGELANQFAWKLEQLQALKLPRLPLSRDQDALVDINQFLGGHEHLLDTKDLQEAQDCLRDILASGVYRGVLSGVSKARLKELKALCKVDLRRLSEPLLRLAAAFTKPQLRGESAWRRLEAAYAACASDSADRSRPRSPGR